MRNRTTTHLVHAYWRGNHWELLLPNTGTIYLTPDDDFETHLHHFLQRLGHDTTNTDFHITYPQAL